ncbi:MAG TPA: 50S ribosomal protein L23 [Gammaproteobacteria bacterium]|jgi:large subunit ribosomal protein L23|nr:50S ribosomal protein L23 [Candidatus Parabeggiatoa sp.]HAI69978.1 50S ribosomal protein L23 [Gammaproteobacteria bacterium]HIE02884.1 50S ribosomal protein L23 [Thiotrichaceae bacterium]
MNPARLMQILIAPHISEKALRLADNHRQFVFKVVQDATKLEIKEAVEYLFAVKVENVQVTSVKGKRKNFGRRPGKRANWKKAYVGLEEGFDINFRGAE